MLREIELSWNEFWAEHWRLEHRHQIPGSFEWDRQLVDFSEQTSELSAPARVLDLACGGGDQAFFGTKGNQSDLNSPPSVPREVWVPRDIVVAQGATEAQREEIS